MQDSSSSQALLDLLSIDHWYPQQCDQRVLVVFAQVHSNYGVYVRGESNNIFLGGVYLFVFNV